VDSKSEFRWNKSHEIQVIGIMKISEIRVYEIKIPLNSVFKHALASRRRSSSVVVELTAQDGTRGYGESSPRAYVTGETTETTMDSIRGLGKKLINIELKPENDAIRQIRNIQSAIAGELRNAPSAHCALELALFDLQGKFSKRPVMDYFGPPKTTFLHYSGVLSDVPLAQTKYILTRMQGIGFTQVKLKVSQDCETVFQKLDLIRSALGDDVEIRIDANGAWEIEEAILNICLFRDQGVDIIEQPLPAARREDYPRLRRAVGSDVRIVIDESLCNVEDAKWFVENKGANQFNIKISKVGGLTQALSIYHYAQANSIPCQLGCHVGETSLLTAAGQIFAASADQLAACEGAYGGHLLAWDIVDRPLQFDQRGRCTLKEVSGGPGLSVSVNAALLEKSATTAIRIV
jgi:L-alanine-DL-glutamate epimerase-like enolase superfamily enzyme